MRCFKNRVANPKIHEYDILIPRGWNLATKPLTAYYYVEPPSSDQAAPVVAVVPPVRIVVSEQSGKYRLLLFGFICVSSARLV